MVLFQYLVKVVKNPIRSQMRFSFFDYAKYRFKCYALSDSGDLSRISYLKNSIIFMSICQILWCRVSS